MEVIGVPIGSDDHIREHMCQATEQTETTTLAKHIETMEDTQVGPLQPSMSLARKIYNLEHHIAPDMGNKAWL